MEKDEKVISRFKTSLKHYQAASYGIGCIDQRFKNGYDRLKKDIFSGREVDPGYFAGASKGVIDRITRKAIFSQIKIAIAAHRAESIFVCDHSDCAAYGGSQRFNSQDEEKAFHKAQLRKAKKILSKEFKDLHIWLFYLDDAVGLIEIF